MLLSEILSNTLQAVNLPHSYHLPTEYQLHILCGVFYISLYLFQSSIMCGLFGSKNNIVVHNPMLVVTIPGHKLSSHLFLLPNANRIETMCFQQIARENWRGTENNFHWIIHKICNFFLKSNIFSFKIW